MANRIKVTKDDVGNIIITPSVNYLVRDLQPLVSPTEWKPLRRYRNWLISDAISCFPNSNLPRWEQLINIVHNAATIQQEAIGPELQNCIVALDGKLFKMLPVKLTSPKTSAISALRASIIAQTQGEVNKLKSDAEREISTRESTLCRREQELTQRLRGELSAYWPGKWQIGTNKYFALSIEPYIDHIIYDGKRASIEPIPFPTLFWVKVLDSEGHYDLSTSGCECAHPHSRWPMGTCLEFPVSLPQTILTPSDRNYLIELLNTALGGINYDSLYVGSNWDKRLAKWDTEGIIGRDVLLRRYASELTWETEVETFATTIRR